MRPPSALTSRIIPTTRDTLTSTRRSVETSPVMNANPRRSRSWNSGRTRMPSSPQTTRSPARTSRSLRHAARPSRTTTTASIRWPSTSTHPPAVAYLRPVVRGRVEVVGDEAVARRGEPRLAVAPGMAAQGDELLDQLAQPLAGVRGDAQLELRELLVGAADREPQHVEAGAALDDLVEDRGEQPRVDEMSLGLDDLAERPGGGGFGNHGLRPQEWTGCDVREAMNASNSRSDRPMRVDSAGRSAMTWAVL